MSVMQEFFLAYGADYDKTMRRFMGNEALYHRLLPKLFQDNTLQKLGEALATNNWKCAFEAAHTLKGVVANLGLTPLYDAVCVIVEPLRKQEYGADYQALYQAIQKELERVSALWTQLEK